MRTPVNVMASQCIGCSTLEHASDCVKPYTASGEDVGREAAPNDAPNLRESAARAMQRCQRRQPSQRAHVDAGRDDPEANDGGTRRKRR